MREHVRKCEKIGEQVENVMTRGVDDKERGWLWKGLAKEGDE